MAKRTPTPKSKTAYDVALEVTSRRPSIAREPGLKNAIETARAISATHADMREPKALYVMVDAQALDRYKRLAEIAGMTMKDYVSRALEMYAAGQLLEALPATEHAVARDAGLPTDPQWSARRLNSHALRLGELEKRVDALQRRVDREWGPDADWLAAEQQARELEEK